MGYLTLSPPPLTCRCHHYLQPSTLPANRPALLYKSSGGHGSAFPLDWWDFPDAVLFLYFVYYPMIRYDLMIFLQSLYHIGDSILDSLKCFFFYCCATVWHPAVITVRQSLFTFQYNDIFFLSGWSQFKTTDPAWHSGIDMWSDYFHFCNYLKSFDSSEHFFPLSILKHC